MRRIRARSRLHGSPHGMPRLPRRRHSAMSQERLFTIQQSGTSTDDYYTPKWIFDALGVHFDLDVCCPPSGPQYTPCAAYYTQKDDGLASDWFGNVWMNPPYSAPKLWVRKFINHAHGIALLPFAKSSWCKELFESDAALAYMLDVQFWHPSKNIKASAPFSLGFWAFGHDNVKALERANIGKVR
jgi:phage N-6-adenine-methyltransferase